ncbi:MAG: hypothetical protein ACXWBP_09280 [Limisphaerales bacterium]
MAISVKEAERAKHAIECKPASIDRNGNWGAPLHGFQLSIRLPKLTFTNGEPVTAKVIFRNVSDKVVSFRREFTNRFPALILKGADQTVLDPVYPKRSTNSFVRHLSDLIKNSSGFPEQIDPCRQREYTIELDRQYALTPGTYSVSFIQQVAEVNEKPILASSKVARFKIIQSAASTPK